MRKLATKAKPKSKIETAIERDALKAVIDCRDGFAQARRSSRVAKRRLLMQAYVIAQAFLTNADEWSAFLEHSIWSAVMKKRPSSKHDAATVMRNVMTFSVGGANRGTASRARRYAGALEGFLAAGFDAAEVAQKLKKPGIQKLIEAAETQRREQKAAAGSLVVEDGAGLLHVKLPPRLFEQIDPLEVGSRIKLIGEVVAQDSTIVEFRIDKVLPRTAKAGARTK